jgi:pyridoxal/pyridoxine/pyridoxamine kinase
MGTTASFTGQLIAYPLQLVRTRLQNSGVGGLPHYTGMGHVFREVLARDGPKGLYRGIGANFAKGIPAVAIGYLAYEESVKAFAPTFD